MIGSPQRTNPTAARTKAAAPMKRYIAPSTIDAAILGRIGNMVMLQAYQSGFVGFIAPMVPEILYLRLPERRP